MSGYLAFKHAGESRSKHINQKEDVMRVQGILMVGFLAVMAVTGATNTADSFASDAYRVDVIDALHETVAQQDSVKTQNQKTRVDVIETIGSDGAVYPYTKPMSH